jgi:Pyridoxamine 5'-phosphate oxidase
MDHPQDGVLDELADVRADDIEDLNHPDAAELLATQTLARLAYTGPDGFPRVIPIGFTWTGEHIVVCTVPSSPKVRALSARPHVALTIDTDQGTASRSLSVRGVAAVEIVDGVPDEYLAASAKSMDSEQARQFEAQVRSLYKQMARITIQPQWARYYDFGTGRIPGFLLELVQGNP